jgi:hypothetical protein
MRILKWAFSSTKGGIWLLLVTPSLLESDSAGSSSHSLHSLSDTEVSYALRAKAT